MYTYDVTVQRLDANWQNVTGQIADGEVLWQARAPIVMGSWVHNH